MSPTRLELLEEASDCANERSMFWTVEELRERQTKENESMNVVIDQAKAAWLSVFNSSMIRHECQGGRCGGTCFPVSYVASRPDTIRVVLVCLSCGTRYTLDFVAKTTMMGQPDIHQVPEDARIMPLG